MLTVQKGGLTLASTTGTQEELEQAVGLSAEEIAANKTERETQAAKESSAAVATSDGAGTVSDPDPDEHADESQLTEEQRNKRKGGWQRKIEKQGKTISTLEETLAEERRARQLLEARLAGGKPAETVASKPAETVDQEPTEEGLNPKTGKPWKDWREFSTAHTHWVMDQRDKAAASSKAAESDQQHVEKTWTEHTQRIAAAQEKYSDWDEVSQNLAKMGEQNISIPQPVALAIVELENGADVLYKLAKEPELIQKLQKMSEVRAIAEIGRIAASLPSEKKEEKVTGSPEAKPPQSAAPEPINPVGGSASTAPVDVSKLSTAEYIRRRNAGLIK
jgi:hypothetical protein